MNEIIEAWQKNLIYKNLSNKLRIVKPDVKKWSYTSDIMRRAEIIIKHARIGHLYLIQYYFISN